MITQIDFVPGDILKVYQKIQEGEKTRIQIFEGVVLGIKGRGENKKGLNRGAIFSGNEVELYLEWWIFLLFFPRLIEVLIGTNLSRNIRHQGEEYI